MTKYYTSAPTNHETMTIEMTMEQWKNIHRDYKGRLEDGTRTAMQYHPTKGTCLYVVKIIKTR